MNPIRAAIAIGIFSLIATACVRAELGFIVNEDGSGIFSYQLAFKDEIAMVSDVLDGDDGFDLVDESDDLPPGSEVREYAEDGYTGVTVSIPVSDFSDLEELDAVQGSFEDTDLDGYQFFDTPIISRDEDGAWQFSMLIAGSDETGDSFGIDDLEDLAEGFASMLFDDGWFRIRVNLPGEIVEHNADRIDEDGLVWELDVLSNEPRQLMARSVPSGVSAMITVVAAIAGSVALLALVSVAYVRRRRR